MSTRLATAEVKTDPEPSIEEILESIRQIISEDAEGEAKPVVVTKPLELTPAPMPSSPGPDLSVVNASASEADAVLDLVDEITPEPLALQQQPEPPQPAPVAPAKVDQPMTENAADTLISPQTAQAVTDELSKLVASNVAVEKEDVGRAGKVTLEDMARELMKPMLKAWLDQNLPTIIERVVQKEVEKLSRRAG